MKEEGHCWGFWDILETVRREGADNAQSQDVDARPGDCQWWQFCRVVPLHIPADSGHGFGKKEFIILNAGAVGFMW